MDSIAQQSPVRRVAVGIDTHKHSHVAVALDELGGRLDELTVPADRSGHERVARWAGGHGRVLAFGIEGTGSYGAGVASYLRRQGHRVIEVNRPDRRERRLNGKNDVLDAENAARVVLSGRATATPKTADGEVEMIRQHQDRQGHRGEGTDPGDGHAQDARGHRTAGVAGATRVLGEDGPHRALRRFAAWADDDPARGGQACPPRSGPPLAAAQGEVREHERHLAVLTGSVAPEMVAAFGIGADTAAEMLIVAGDNPDRVRSEPAWAKLCGVCPVPASSGRTSRYRLNRGGHRQANSALYRTVIVRLRFHQPTIDYVARRTAEGKTKAEIIRCLKRYVAREVFGYLHPERHPVAAPELAA